MRAPNRLIELYRADDLPGFIKEWRRLNPGQSGAVQAWFNMSLRAGVYDVDEEEDP